MYSWKFNYYLLVAFGYLKRFVPYTAVAAANCVNIPLMRQNEIKNGVDVCDDKGNVVGKSRVAAVKGISQVVFSRIAMCTPGMLLMPVLMERIEAIPFYKQRAKYIDAPFQTIMVGFL